MSISTWVLKFSGVTGQYLSLLLQGTIKTELEQVLPVAMNAVQDIANDPTLLTPGEKRNAAFVLIANHFMKKQIPVAESVVNLSLELAVQKLRAVGVITIDTMIKG